MVVMEENQKIMSVQKFLEQINYVYLNKYPSKNPKKIVIPHVRVQRLPSHIIAKYTKRSNPENLQSSAVGCKEKIKALRPTDESLCTVGSDKNESVYDAAQATLHTDSSDSDFPDLINPKKKNMKKKKKKITKEVTSGKVLESNDIPALLEKSKKLYDSQVKAVKKDKVSKQKQPRNSSQSDLAFVKDTVTTSQPHTETENIVNDQAEGTSTSPDVHKDSGLVIVSCESLASSSKDQEKDLFSPPLIPSPLSPQHSSSPVQKPIPSLEVDTQKLPDYLRKIRANMGKSVSRPIDNSPATHLKPADSLDIPQRPEEDKNDIGHYDSDGKESVGSDETVIFDDHAVNRKEAFEKDTKIMPTSLEAGIVNSYRLHENTEDIIEGNMQMNVVLQAKEKAVTDTSSSPQSVDRPHEENKTDSARGSGKRRNDNLSEDAPNKRIKIEPHIPPKETGPMVVIPMSPTLSICKSSFTTKNSVDLSVTTACREDLSVAVANLPKSPEQGKETDCSEAVTDSTGPQVEVQDSCNSPPTTNTCEAETEPPQVTLEPSVDKHIVSTPLPSEVSNAKSNCQTTASQYEGNVSTVDSSLEKLKAVDSVRQQPEEMEEEEQRSSSSEVIDKEISEEDRSEKDGKIISKTKSGTKQTKGLEADKKHANAKIRKHNFAAVMKMVERKNKLEEKIEKLKQEMERKISSLEKKKKNLEKNISKALTQMNEEVFQGTLSSDEDDVEDSASDKDVSAGSPSSPSSSISIPKSDSAYEATKDPSDSSVAESTSFNNKSKGEKMVSGSSSSCMNTETVPKKVDNNKSTVSDKHCASNIKIIEAAKIVCFGNPQEQGSDPQNPPQRHKEKGTKDVRFQIKPANRTSGKSTVAPDNKNKKENVSTLQPGQKKIVNSNPKPSISGGTDAAVTLDTNVSAPQSMLNSNSLSLNLVPKNRSEKSQSIGDCTSTQIGKKIPLQQPVQTQQLSNKGQGQPKQLLNVVQQPQVIQKSSQQQPQPLSHQQVQQRNQNPPQKQVQQTKQRPSQKQIQTQKAKQQLQHQEAQQVMQHSQQAMQQSHQHQIQQVMQQSQPQQPQNILQQLHQQQPLLIMQQLPQQQSQLVVQQSNQQQPQLVMQQSHQQQPHQQQPHQQQPQNVMQQPLQQQSLLRKQLHGYPSQVRAQPEKVVNVYQNPQVQQMQIQQNAQQNQLNHWQQRPPQSSVVIPASTAVGTSVGNLTSKSCNQRNIALAPRMTVPVLTTRNASPANISWPVSSAPVVNKNAWQGQQQTCSLDLASVSRQSGPAMTTPGENLSSQSSVVNVPQRYSGAGGSQSNFGTTSYAGPVSDGRVVVPGGPVTLAGYQVGQGKDTRPNTLASTASSGNLRNVLKKQVHHNQQFGMPSAVRHHNMPHGAHQTNIQLPQTNVLAGYPQSGSERGKSVGTSEGVASVEEQQWCFICGKVGEFTCCSGIIYCSDVCQRMDWERHSKECMKRT